MQNIFKLLLLKFSCTFHECFFLFQTQALCPAPSSALMASSISYEAYIASLMDKDSHNSSGKDLSHDARNAKPERDKVIKRTDDVIKKRKDDISKPLKSRYEQTDRDTNVAEVSEKKSNRNLFHDVELSSDWGTSTGHSSDENSSKTAMADQLVAQPDLPVGPEPQHLNASSVSPDSGIQSLAGSPIRQESPRASSQSESHHINPIVVESSANESRESSSSSKMSPAKLAKVKGISAKNNSTKICLSNCDMSSSSKQLMVKRRGPGRPPKKNKKVLLQRQMKQDYLQRKATQISEQNCFSSDNDSEQTDADFAGDTVIRDQTAHTAIKRGRKRKLTQQQCVSSSGPNLSTSGVLQKLVNQKRARPLLKPDGTPYKKRGRPKGSKNLVYRALISKSSGLRTSKMRKRIRPVCKQPYVVSSLNLPDNPEIITHNSCESSGIIQTETVQFKRKRGRPCKYRPSLGEIPKSNSMKGFVSSVQSVDDADFGSLIESVEDSIKNQFQTESEEMNDFGLGDNFDTIVPTLTSMPRLHIDKFSPALPKIRRPKLHVMMRNNRRGRRGKKPRGRPPRLHASLLSGFTDSFASKGSFSSMPPQGNLQLTCASFGGDMTNFGSFASCSSDIRGKQLSMGGNGFNFSNFKSYPLFRKHDDSKRNRKKKKLLYFKTKHKNIVDPAFLADMEFITRNFDSLLISLSACDEFSLCDYENQLPSIFQLPAIIVKKKKKEVQQLLDRYKRFKSVREHNISEDVTKDKLKSIRKLSAVDSPHHNDHQFQFTNQQCLPPKKRHKLFTATQTESNYSASVVDVEVKIPERRKVGRPRKYPLPATPSCTSGKITLIS